MSEVSFRPIASTARSAALSSGRTMSHEGLTMSSARRRNATIAVAAFAAGLSVWAFTRGPLVSRPSPTPVASAPAETVSRRAAEALVRNDRENVKAISRLAAKQMRFGDLRKAMGAPNEWSPNLDVGAEDGRLIWVVAMSGDWVPDIPGLPGGAPIPHDRWAVQIISATADAGLTPIDGVQASSMGSWPPYFDTLPDTGAQ
jgi:hypothetical protein